MQLKRQIKSCGFEYSDRKPEFIVSYGGDGTFLVAERRYPGIPKVLIREASICRKCHKGDLTHLLELIKAKRFRIAEYLKLEAVFRKKRFVCTNDFIVRNLRPTEAIRFTLKVNRHALEDEFIGDGIVVSTPFGSSAYFHSIARMSFESGIGVAFNNLVEKVAPMFLHKDDKLEFRLERGDAVLACDNDERAVKLKKGDRIVIKRSSDVARIMYVAKHYK